MLGKKTAANAVTTGTDRQNRCEFCPIQASTHVHMHMASTLMGMGEEPKQKELFQAFIGTVGSTLRCPD